MEKYFKFDGTATRGEFWAVNLIGGVVAAVVAAFGIVLIDAEIEGSTFLTAIGFCLLAANLVAVVWLSVATSIRRCHDAGINRWWTFAACLPFIGWIVLIVIGCLKTDNE